MNAFGLFLPRIHEAPAKTKYPYIHPHLSWSASKSVGQASRSSYKILLGDFFTMYFLFLT